jgi:hypothetical protein
LASVSSRFFLPSFTACEKIPDTDFINVTLPTKV